MTARRCLDLACRRVRRPLLTSLTMSVGLSEAPRIRFLRGVANGHGMTASGALTSAKVSPGQSPQAFARAHRAAGHGAAKKLKRGNQNCATGRCRPEFKTKEEAAKAALKSVNDKSIADNKEYAGQIYRNPDGTYGYTDPVQGTGDESHPSSSPVPDGTDVAGNYHTHGDYSVMTEQGVTRASTLPGITNPASFDAEADNFSPADVLQYQQLGKQYSGFTGYLGTPSGNMRAFDTTNGQSSIVGPLK